jgi:hypothetical protein
VAAFSPAPFVARGRGRVVIETFGALPHYAATNESFKRAQRSVILWGDKADRVANGMGATGASDAMNIILRVHRKIVVHHMRDSIHVNATRGDVGRDEDTDGAGLEILQRAHQLVLRTIGMNGARFDSTAFQTACDPVGSVFCARENEHGIELWVSQKMKQ